MTPSRPCENKGFTNLMMNESAIPPETNFLSFSKVRAFQDESYQKSKSVFTNKMQCSFRTIPYDGISNTSRQQSKQHRRQAHERRRALRMMRGPSWMSLNPATGDRSPYFAHDDNATSSEDSRRQQQTRRLRKRPCSMQDRTNAKRPAYESDRLSFLDQVCESVQWETFQKKAKLAYEDAIVSLDRILHAFTLKEQNIVDIVKHIREA